MNINANNVIVDDELEVAKKRKKSSQEQLKLNASSKKGFLKNVQHNANKNLLKVLALGAAGAVIYPLVPTLVLCFSGIVIREKRRVVLMTTQVSLCE